MERRVIAERNCGKDLDQSIKTLHIMIQDGCIFPCSMPVTNPGASRSTPGTTE